MYHIRLWKRISRYHIEKGRTERLPFLVKNIKKNIHRNNTIIHRRIIMYMCKKDDRVRKSGCITNALLAEG